MCEHMHNQYWACSKEHTVRAIDTHAYLWIGGEGVEGKEEEKKESNVFSRKSKDDMKYVARGHVEFH